MRIRRAIGLGVALIILWLCGLGSGCTASRDSRKDAWLAEAEQLLDNKDYTRAIEYLLARLDEMPGDLDLEPLLANAYMGRAGFELLPVVKALMGPQSAEPLGLNNEPECRTEAIRALSDESLTCVLYRLLKQLPPPDHPDFIRAQAIYRTYFPDPAQASSQINFSAGILELCSALTRLRILLDQGLNVQMTDALTDDPQHFPFEITIHHAKRFISEVNWGLLRFSYSYDQISKFIQSLHGSTLYSIGPRVLEFNGSLSVPDLLRFAALVLLDKSGEFDRWLSDVATRRMHEMSEGAFTLLHATDGADTVADVSGAPNFSLHAARYVSSVLDALASSMDQKVKITLFELAWRDPPPIIRLFLTAAADSWESESGDPLRSYFTQSRADWLEFKDIAQGWDRWLNEDLTPVTRAQLLDQVTADATAHPEFLTLPGPGQLDSASLTTWLTQTLGFLDSEVRGIGSRPGLLLPPQYAEAVVLLDRTDVWMTRNFRPVSDWAELISSPSP